MRRAVLLTLMLLATAALPATAQLRTDALEADFREFHRSFAISAYHYPRHGAAPLGLVGFDIYADVAVAPAFDDRALEDDLPGDFMSVVRVGGRKGLPGGIDLGVAYGRALGVD